MIVPPPDWALWRAEMERSNHSELGRAAGVWALEVLERKLGSEWPLRVYEATASSPSELFGYGYAVEFGKLLELALRLIALESVRGCGRVRTELRRDLRHERRHHSSIQLEVAALAHEVGWRTAMEVRTSVDAPPSDVLFAGPAGEISVEARVVLRDDASRAATAYWDSISERLLEVEARFGVVVSGGIDEFVTQEALEALFVGIRQSAKRVAATKVSEDVQCGFGRIKVLAGCQAESVSFSGPKSISNGWPRLALILDGKVAQAERSHASWLRVDVLDGLWQLTGWAASPLPSKTEQLASAVRGALRSSQLSGIVMSSGAALSFGGHQPEEYLSNSGAIGLRTLIAPVRVRETIIAPLTTVALADADAWLKLYKSEPGWLPKALAAQGFQPFDEVMAWR